MSAKRKNFVVAILLALHLAIDGAIVGWIRRPEDNPWLLLALAAVPLAQATLVAAWAAFSSIRSYLRVPLAVGALAWLWHVECCVLGFECRDYLSADHALSLATQGMLIFLVLLAVRTVAWVLHRREKTHHKTPVQFSISFLLCWTAALAIMLGLGKTALEKSGWTTEFIEGRMIFVGLVIGTYDAAVGLLALSVFLGRKFWLVKAIGALLLIAMLLSTEKLVLESLFEFSWMVSTWEWYALAGFHLVYLIATLLPYVLWGGTFLPKISSERSEIGKPAEEENTAFKDHPFAVE